LESGGSYTGTLAIPNSDKGGSAVLNVSGTFNSTGVPTVLISPEQELTTKDGLPLTISAGAIAGNPAVLSLTGVIKLPNPNLTLPKHGQEEPAVFPLLFQDLAITAKGNVDQPALQLSQPTEIDFHAFKLHAQSISGFKGDGTGGLTLHGPVEMAGDLPLSHPEQFQGVPLIAGKLVLTAVQPFALDVDLAGIGRIKGEIKYQQDPKSGPVMTGTVAFQLGGDGSDGDDADLGGATLTFKVGDGAWYVTGGFDFPNPGIPIPSTGLNLRALRGGFGRKITFGRGPRGELTDIELAPAAAPNFFFTAEVRVSLPPTLPPGMQEINPLWFDVVLTVADNPLLIDLQGGVYVKENYSPINEKPDESTLSRYGEADITWDGATKTFRASADAHLYVPSRKLTLVKAEGSMELVVGPGDKHFYLGWPFPEHSVNITAFKNTLEGGVGMVLEPLPASFSAAFKESFSFGPLSGEIDGAFQASYPPLNVSGALHASGEVDFYVFTVGAEAFLNASANGDNLHFAGEFTGYIDTWFGDISASVDIAGDLPPL
jgi:hypothetical protein